MWQRWWDRPVIPYLVLVISPALTLPPGGLILSSLPDCGADEPWWELRHFEIALAPGLADLLPFLWLLSGAAAVRRAAIVAGLIGAARYVIPQAATLLYAATSGGQESASCPISSFFVAWLVPLILALWLASALAAATMLLRARRAPIDPRG